MTDFVLFSFFLLFLAITGVESSCRYKIFSEKTNYTTALKNCEKIPGWSLATFETAKEMQQIVDLVRNANYQAWINLRKDPINCNKASRSSTSSELAKYTTWGVGGPMASGIALWRRDNMESSFGNCQEECYRIKPNSQLWDITCANTFGRVCSTCESSDCGRNRELTGAEGVILSHSSTGRSRYSNNLKCKWIVTGLPGKVVRLRFDAFSLEGGSGCKRDRLTVYDGPDDTNREIARLCGLDLPADIYSGGQNLTLKFSSNERTTYFGFRIRYKVIDESSDCGRGEELHAQEGVIFSHPSAGRSNYPNHVNFKWIIIGRPGKVVRIHFDVFSLETCSGCMCDWLTVNDGPDDTNREIARLCGSDRPADIYSSGQSLTLRFKSGGSKTDRGFWIRYKVISKATKINTSPSPGVVRVGTLLHCAADGSPPARVNLRLSLHGFCREIASGIGSAEYRLPMSTSEGNGTIRCIANNSIGEDEKSAVITVKKLPLPVVFDAGDSLLNTTDQRTMSCRTEHPDADLDFLQLYFSSQQVYIRTWKDQEGVETFTMITGFRNITTFPHAVAGVTIVRPPTSFQAIQVILTASPRHNGCTVTCAAYSKPDKGKEGKKTRTIQVRWPPSVRSLRVHGSDDSSSPVTTHKPASITCELQMGGPRQEEIALVTATVGGRDLGAPQVIRDLGEDEDGYKWKEAMWSHQFRLEDNGTSVVCGFQGEEDNKSLTLDVLYKPRSFILSPAREIFAGESVNCSAAANPPPVVKIEGFGRTARGVSVAYLAVPTTAKGRYNVSCTAKNSVGSESTTVAIVVHKKRIPISFSVSQSGQDIISSIVTLRCLPQSSHTSLSYVNLTFAGGHQVFWKEGKVHNLQHHILRQEFDEDRKSLTVAVRAAPFMRGAVQCRLQSVDFSSVGVEERQIELKWRAEPRRLFTRIENRSGKGMKKESDTLIVTCEVEVGSPPTKESVEFSGWQTDGRRAIGADIPSDGWTLRNVSTRVRLSWRHDGETIGCSLGGKTLTKRLTVEYAPRSLLMSPSLVNPGQAVRCTAVARPTPTVRLRPVNPQPGWTEITGNGTAELLVGRNADEKSYAVVCEAKNRHGAKKWISAISVQIKSVKSGNRRPT